MAQMKNTTITIKPLGENTFDILIPKKKWDCHLRKEGRQWMLSIFNSTIRNASRAFIESTPMKGKRSGPDWNDVLGYLEGI
jgi:hypothetical protein